MKNKIYFLFLLLTLSYGAKGQQDSIPYVILISFDGFRHDYADSLSLPNINKFIENGTHADALIPCFPSLTFPNHYSIVTGLYPENHGIVENNFYDRTRNEVYHFYKKETNNNPYYYRGKTLWALAREQGIKTASYYWLGSDLPDPLLQPDYFYDFGKGGNSEDKIDQTIRWLELPLEVRPHLITIYFSFPDSPSHIFGPWHKKTKEAVLSVDSLIGDLLQKVEKLNLPINIIVVSDHGLSEIKVNSDTFIDFESLIDLSNPNFITIPSGAAINIYANDTSKIDSLYAELKHKEGNFTVLKKTEFPQNWHYKANARIGDLLVLANKGHYIPRNNQKEAYAELELGSMIGVHGYDPYQNKDMHGIFYAMGPNIKKGIKIPAFENIDIFPFVAELLHLKIPEIDGNKEALKEVYLENK